MLLIFTLLSAFSPALAETGSPMDTGSETEDDDSGCGDKDGQAAALFGVLLAMGAGIGAGRRKP